MVSESNESQKCACYFDLTFAAVICCQMGLLENIANYHCQSEGCFSLCGLVNKVKYGSKNIIP